MASDDFTGDNGTALATHDADWGSQKSPYLVGNAEIQSNAVQTVASSDEIGARYTTSSEDLSQIIFKGGSYANNTRHVCVRSDATQLGYSATLVGLSGDNFGTVAIYKDLVWKGQTTGQTIDRTADQTLKVTASGTDPVTVKAYVGGVEIVSYEDSSSPIASGNPGFFQGFIAQADGIWDDWTDGAAAGPAIATVDSPVLDAEQDNVLTTTGYAADIDDLTIQDVTTGNYEVDVSASIAGTAGSFTFDMPDISTIVVDTLGTAFDSASHTHTITAVKGAESDTETIVVNPQSGRAVVEIASAVKTEGSWFEGWTGTPADTDQVEYPTANNLTIAATGVFSTDQTTGYIKGTYFDTTDYKWKASYVQLTATTCALTGTAASAVESDIVDGGKTIILTLTDDEWIASGATFNAQRQAIINGLDSAQAEVAGWDAEVKANEVVGAVVRTSSTVVTITLTAAAAYAITASETITATIPAAALLVSDDDVVASPTFVIANETPPGVFGPGGPGAGTGFISGMGKLGRR